MAQAVFRAAALPDAPLDAAGLFLAHDLPKVRASLSDEVCQALAIVFAPASREHRAWRRAVIQSLAREAAPRRVNGIAGAHSSAVEEALVYLASAPGITGQLLEVTGPGGQNP